MLKYILSIFLSIIIAFSVCAQAVGTQIDCFFANSSPVPPAWREALLRCHSDTENIAGYYEAAFAITILKIRQQVIRFRGCGEMPFAVKEEMSSFDIIYPTGKAKSDYIAPLYHELAHVYQIVRFGGRERALEVHGSLKTLELCSDLVAGYLIARAGKFQPQDFQQNVILRGNYKGFDQNFHGTPGERVNAFRYGYYTSGTSADLNTQYDLALNRKLCNP